MLGNKWGRGQRLDSIGQNLLVSKRKEIPTVQKKCKLGLLRVDVFIFSLALNEL